ncbi:prolyl oligopeptidase family serine peptidase [Natrarchaeobius sp. A-rgal3]|uniref:S9 family peptidase n=1 Tax=Natrarchaeobius versutus TaxID=1679078 RepID=UPI0035104E77
MTVGDFERYANIRRANGPSIDQDGSRLAFLLDVTGVRQLYRIDGPRDWPQQLTFTDERVSFAAWSPTRDELIFGMDEGGNEHTQLFRIDGDGHRTTQLTDASGSIHRWGAWSSDGSRFAYTANRRDHSSFDVYVQKRNEFGDDARLVYEGEGMLSVVGWCPDDNRLAICRDRSSFDRELLVLEVESGRCLRVTDHTDGVRYDDIRWGPGGESLYCATDRGSDTKYLARIEVATGAVETVVERGEWNIECFDLEPNSRRVVFGTNVDGYTKLTTGELVDDLTVREFPTPALPSGVYRNPCFANDGSTVALTVSGSVENENIYVLEVATGASHRWTDVATAGIPKESFVEPELIRYESFDGLEVPAFFSVPADATAEQMPVIVDIHGGPESQRRPRFNGIKQYYLQRGYAYFEPNIRGSSGYGRIYSQLDDVERRVDAIEDVKAGVDWLQNQPEVDRRRIVAFGGSYGGFVVLAAMTEYPELWAAGVDLFGIANLITFLENTGEWRREHRESEYGSLEDDAEFLESISPIHDVERIEAPLLVLHGRNDPRVPASEAERIVEKVAEQEVPVEKRIFEDEGHGFTKRENLLEAYSIITAFLDEHVE